jgi:rhodanese-related sulfurtransferase
MSMPGPIPAVDVTEAERRVRDDPERPILLDVREVHEFVAVRAPGALHIPMSTFQARAGEVPTDRPILVVCHSGSRSAAVTGFLLRSGRTDVANVAGGMEAWANAGLPTRSGQPDPGEGELSG